MQVALMANTAWLDEELSLLRRLVVGLMDEQVRVVQVLPEPIAAEETTRFGQHLAWKDTRWAPLRRRRIARTAARLEEMEVELIHALDGRLWLGAAMAAQRLRVPAVLWAWSPMDLPLVEAARRAAPDVKLAVAATTEPLQRALAQRAPVDVTVDLITPGAATSAGDGQGEFDDNVLCAVVSGNGVFDDEYGALFEAMRHLVNDYPQAQFFLDGQGANQQAIWQHARRCGLLPNVSMVPRRLGHRELLLRADVLIHPQPLGKARSLTLQAMASRLPVIARSDPWLDYYIEDTTAWLVDAADPPRWDQRLRALLTRRDEAEALAERARAWVQEHRPMSRTVASTLSLYHAVAPQAIRFPA